MTSMRVWVAGHRGMVGAAILRKLGQLGFETLTIERAQLDLLEGEATLAYLRRVRPDAIVLAAARVGGILANSTRPAEFLMENLTIARNVISAAHLSNVDRLLYLGSSCIYPKFAPQPIPESALMTGPLEPTNEGYAVAKIAGVSLCQAYRRQYGRRYISIMPCNLYGPHDNYDPGSSHVLAALIDKLHVAKTAGSAEAVVWGTGAPLREFMHVDDLAEAAVFCLKRYDDPQPLNCGSGEEISIADLARLVADVVGYPGALRFDPSMPDGTPRKLMDSRRLAALGWRPRISLRDGIASAYAWYLEAGAGRAAGLRRAS